MAEDPFDAWAARMRAVLNDAEADLALSMGGLVERSSARVWHGQVLVDWERDDDAGGCLLHPELVVRLGRLGARAEARGHDLRVVARPRIVAALGPRHASLAGGLHGAPTLELTLRRGSDDAYVGGVEAYRVTDAPLMRLEAVVRPRPTPAGPASERTGPATA